MKEVTGWHEKRIIHPILIAEDHTLRLLLKIENAAERYHLLGKSQRVQHPGIMLGNLETWTSTQRRASRIFNASNACGMQNKNTFFHRLVFTKTDSRALSASVAEQQKGNISVDLVFDQETFRHIYK